MLMLSAASALESYAVRSASKALEALARRMPSIAHRRESGKLVDIDLSDVRISDELVVFPHEICPVDGTVVEGHSAMDESYLTGEPYVLSKTPGSQVLSGAVNGEGALTIRADKLPIDSRYAKIVEVMRAFRTTTTTYASARRPTRRVLYSAIDRDCGYGLVRHWGSRAISGGVGGSDALPVVDCYSGDDHRRHFVGG